MAQGVGTIKVDMPTLTLRVRMPRAYGLRMWATAVLLRLAGAIGPHDIEIEVVDQPWGGRENLSNRSIADTAGAFVRTESNFRPKS
ncbi:MAG: hypothetical protein JWQ89_2265 [Devosia sp.]|nr:hypothetical protein [Devosia sp.]